MSEKQSDPHEMTGARARAEGLPDLNKEAKPMTITTSAGKINASKSTLNKLCLLACTAAERYRNDGMNALAKEADDISEAIHDALADLGYYEF